MDASISERDASRISRAEAVARRLTDEIAEGRHQPGDRLGTKGELRRRFGVAVATINEVVRLLETSGYAEARPGPGGGVFVAEPSSTLRLSNLVLGFSADPKTMADCLMIRNALEPLVCEEAARRPRKADVAALERILDRMDSPDPAGFLRANWDFHRHVAGMGDNPTAGAIYITLLDFVEDQLALVEPGESFHASRNVAVHREIAAAIASRDRRKVAAAVRRHAPVVEERALALSAAAG